MYKGKDSIYYYWHMDTFITHAGRFHADDVMCAALMRVMWPDIKIIRTNDPPERVPDGTVIADVGGGAYDHHSKRYEPPARMVDGGPHASIGLLMEEFAEELFPSRKSFEDFYKKIIVPVEDYDNGIGDGNLLSELLNSYNPVWDSDENQDEAFIEAEAVAERFIRNELDAIWSRNRAYPYVKEAYERSDGWVVVLKKSCPCQGILCKTSALFVVFPSDRGITLQCINEGSDSRIPKQPITGSPEDYPGCTFIHKAQFLAEFDTAEHAKCAGEKLAGRYYKQLKKNDNDNNDNNNSTTTDTALNNSNNP